MRFLPSHTGLGVDNVAPRALLRLPIVLIQVLCVLLHAVELLGKWPRALLLVYIILLAKPD